MEECRCRGCATTSTSSSRPEQLAERLTLLGMEVKGIERWGADWQNVVVGELLTVEKHPRADRLSLTTVTLGSGEPLEIVCGATNIAPGQRIPVALPGAVLPGDRRIERTEKMGVVSNGMLCSGDELRLTADARRHPHPARRHAARRARSTDLYGDVVLDVDVKPNRGDALSLVGLAREVVGRDRRAGPLPGDRADRGPASRSTRTCASRSRSRSCARASSAAGWAASTVGPSPDDVQMRLIAAGQRPVSNVVDVSNYVMLELGKPIHTFDAAAVRDGRAHRPPGARRASGSRRSTTSSASSTPRHAGHRRPGRPVGHRRRHGRGRVGDLGRDDATSSSSRPSSTR